MQNRASDKSQFVGVKESSPSGPVRWQERERTAVDGRPPRLHGKESFHGRRLLKLIQERSGTDTFNRGTGQ